jgi:hypothetical protein
MNFILEKLVRKLKLFYSTSPKFLKPNHQKKGGEKVYTEASGENSGRD